MIKPKDVFFTLLLSVACSGCAFFNTYYNAKKAYENGLESLKRNKEQTQEQNLNAGEISFERFSLEPKSAGYSEAKQFFDIAIEKANKVVALHAKSSWVENAILLLGKAYYMRALDNDYYDAKNRFEVFIIRFPDSKDLPEAKLWYGKTLIKLKQADEAKKVFTEIQTLTNDKSIQAESLIYLGDLSADNQDYQAAAERYSKAAALAADSHHKQHATFKAAYCYFKTKDYRSAEVFFDALNKTDLDFSDRFDVLLMKARSLKFDGQYDRALELLDGMISDLRFKAHFIRAEFEIADVLRLKGKSFEAMDQYNYVISNYDNPNFSDDAYYFLGLMNDAPPVLCPDGFTPNLYLAKKYYYLVRSKYSSSNYFPAASARFDYLMKIDFLKGMIRAHEALLNVTRSTLENPGSLKMNVDVLEEFRQDSVKNEREEKQMLASLGSKKSHRAINTKNFAFTTAPADTAKKARIDSTSKRVAKKKGSLWTNEFSKKDSIKNDTLLTGAAIPKDSIPSPFSDKLGRNGKEVKKDDWAEVKVFNKDLFDGLVTIQLEITAISQSTNKDSLSMKAQLFFDQTAEAYAVLADYFYNDLGLYDSAQFYYQSVLDKFQNSTSTEMAMYACARIEQKKNNPNYLSFYERAYNQFPNGKLAAIGRQFLNKDEPLEDSSLYRYEQAEKNLLKDGNYPEALRWYQAVAQDSASRFRLSALYAMGLLYEKQLNDHTKAFRIYHTLMYAAPNSEWARLVKPKVAAYIQQKNISPDSLIHWVDTNYVRIETAGVKVRASDSSDSTSLPGVNSDSAAAKRDFKSSDHKLLPNESGFSDDDSTAIKSKKDEFFKKLKNSDKDREKRIKKKDDDEKSDKE
jgi:tetratricopeptide (TPR) repeat protein